MTARQAPIRRYLERIADHPVFVAYNANVDAIVGVDERLEAVLAPPAADPSTPIDSAGDLSAAIAATMAAGEGDERRITDAFGAWLDEHLDPDDRRLGGQAGISADVLSVLGAAPILYTYLFSPTQRSMFAAPERLRFPVVEGGDLAYRPASGVTNADRTKTNWIFEFPAGREFFDARAVTDTRFIAAARPERFNLEVGDLDAHAGRIGADVECALLAGYHNLKAEYADGTTFADHIGSGASFLRRLRDGGDVPVQMEYGVTHLEPLRAAIVEEIVPHVDAIGVDTRELGLLADDLDVAAGGEDGIVDTYERARAVRGALGVPCVKLHATDYFMAVTDGYLDPGAVRRGFEFASVVGATKARTGEITSPDDLDAGADVPLSEAGREAVAALGDHLGTDREGPAIEAAGIVVHPNRVVENPAGTVGLGDAVSAASFALETALH